MDGILKSLPQADVFTNFHVFFLSAKYGLIEATTHIRPYDAVLTANTAHLTAYANEHRHQANTLLARYAGQGVQLYTVLYKNYLAAFELMDLTALQKFDAVHHSRNARGVGVHRGRLKTLVTHQIQSKTPISKQDLLSYWG